MNYTYPLFKKARKMTTKDKVIQSLEMLKLTIILEHKINFEEIVRAIEITIDEYKERVI